jgi:transglutaminase-like putative cysteine protease
MGQKEFGLSFLMIVVAGLSVWLTDVKVWFYLNRAVANVIMLVAAIFSMGGIFHIQSETQALNFARFLIYLQIVLLFQKKDSRIYWLLIMLSLLQVVVSALFSQGAFFGVLLIGYMVFASLALTLLMLNRHSEPPRAKPERWFTWGFDFFRKKSSPSASNASSDRAIVAQGAEGSSSIVKKDSRWPLADQKPEFDGSAAGGDRQGVVGELYRWLFGMAMRTLGLTLVLFIVVPRFSQVGWGGGFAQPLATVGFSDKVTLGEMGQIIENPDEVMRIHFYQGETDIPYVTNGEIYLFGGLLMGYQQGEWSAGHPAVGDILTGHSKRSIERESKLPKSFVMQKCDIGRLDHNELFFIDPYIGLENNSYGPDSSSCRLMRDDSNRRGNFTYRLGTTAFIRGVQSPLTPSMRNDNVEQARHVPKDDDGKPVLKKLQQLTDEWIAESDLPPEKVYERAKYIEKKLGSSGLFQYSLDGQDRDPTMDPIEDFLTTHRAGHCEYFASALTLMLRHAGIPARMVVGFKCDEFHEMEQCYQVRQLHAHAWSQAYLKYDQLPKEWLHGTEKWNWEKEGGWLRLDATPSSEAATNQGVFAPVRNAMQWLDFAWSYYIVELNSERQQKAIFEPVADFATKAYHLAKDPKTWRRFFDRIGEALHRSGAAGLLAWTLLILVVALSFAFFALVGYLFWRLGRKMWRMFAGKRGKRRVGPKIEIEFYRRLEQLLKKNGLVRPLGQTPREFAGIAGRWLAELTGEHRLAPLPSQIVDAYYGVRFGRHALDDPESREIDQVLHEIESQILSHRLASK